MGKKRSATKVDHSSTREELHNAFESLFEVAIEAFSDEVFLNLYRGNRMLEMINGAGIEAVASRKEIIQVMCESLVQFASYERPARENRKAA